MTKLDCLFVNRLNNTNALYSGPITQYNTVFPELVYEVAFDQASKVTGFYITESHNRIAIIGHITRQERESIEEYLSNIDKFINKLLTGSVSIFVREKPLPYNGSRTSQVLADVARHYDRWTSETSNMLLFSKMGKQGVGRIYPNVWRKHALDKSKGKDRHMVKREIALDLLDKYPEFARYFHSIPVSSDYDGFEALGILHGFKEEAKITYTSEDSVYATRLAGDKTHTGSVALFYTFFKKDNIPDLNEGLKYAISKIGEPDFVEANYEKSLYDNTRVAASNYKFSVVMYFSEYHTKSMQMRFGDTSDADSMIVVVIRNALVYEGLRSYMQEYFKHEIQTW